MHSNHLEVRSLLNTLTEIKIRHMIRANLPISSSLFSHTLDTTSSTPHPFSRTPSRYGLNYLFIEHQEVQRFLLTLSSTYLYSPSLSHYQHHLAVQQIPYLEIFHALNLSFHSNSRSKDLNFIKCVHETGHLLVSHLHPFSIFKPISVFVSTNSSSHTDSTPYLLSAWNSFRSLFTSSHTLSKATDENTAILLNSSDLKSVEYSRGLVAICLGGMAAEYVIYGTISPRGSDDDLKEVLKEIQRKNNYFPLSAPSSSASEKDLTAGSSIIETMTRYLHSVLEKVREGEVRSDGVLWIDDIMIQIISEEFHRAVEILRKNEKAILAISESLMDRMNQHVDISETLLPLLPPKDPSVRREAPCQ
jgi:hypothetical protein